MYLFYLDDSSDGKLNLFSALGVHEKHWREVFGQVKKMRQTLKKSAGIYMNKELHAWKFVSGRGRPADRHLDHQMRLRVFRYVLRTIASMGQEKVLLLNSVNNNQQYAYERLLNRINRTMAARGDHALIISDEGKEGEYTRLVRRMGAWNPIPSRFGTWEGTSDSAKNIPIDRIIEDPVFRQSDSSYLIQVVDFCAYALLRHERPLESKGEFNQMFGFLEPICFKLANRNDPLGIIR